jgi:hypothetical protein
MRERRVLRLMPRISRGTNFAVDDPASLIQSPKNVISHHVSSVSIDDEEKCTKSEMSGTLTQWRRSERETLSR